MAEEGQESLIAQLLRSNRLYYIPYCQTEEEKARHRFILVEGRGEQIMLSPSHDFDMASKDLLFSIIQRKIHYNGNISNDIVFREMANACSTPCPHKSKLLMGAYLFLAGLTSCVEREHYMSFLQGARLALEDFKQKGWTGPDYEIAPEHRKEWFIEMFNILGIGHLPLAQKFIEDWMTKGYFEIDGSKHDEDKGNISGEYVILADKIISSKIYDNGQPKEISLRFDQLAEVRSWAVGANAPLTKWNLYHDRKPEEVLEVAKIALADYRGKLDVGGIEAVLRAETAAAIRNAGGNNLDAKAVDNIITKAIDRISKGGVVKEYLSKRLRANPVLETIKMGFRIRRQSFFRHIKAEAKKHRGNSFRPETNKFMEEFLPSVHPVIQKLALTLDTRIVIGDADSLEPMITKNIPAGTGAQKDHEITKTSYGVAYPSHDIVFICRAGRTNSQLGSTLAHELGHRFIGNDFIRQSPEFWDVVNNGAITNAGRASQLLRDAGSLYKEMSKAAVEELKDILKPETAMALQTPLHAAGIIKLVEALTAGARTDLYTSLSGYAKTDLYLVLPSEYRSKLFITMSSAEQEAMFNALIPEYRYDLYNSLPPAERTKLTSWLTDAQKQELAKFEGTTPYAPPYIMNDRTWTELNEKITKESYMADMFSILTSGTEMDLYYRLVPENRGSLMLSATGLSELQKGIDGKVMDLDVSLKELRPVLEEAVLRQFTAELPEAAAKDIVDNYQRVSLIKLGRTKIYDDGSRENFAQMLNPKSVYYNNYFAYQKDEEVLQNIMSGHFSSLFDSKLPQGKAMEPLTEFRQRMEQTVTDGINYIEIKKKERDKIINATAAASI